jgi:endonuclease/exonuclease/phosphatase family metal-dependent hydrolase
LLWTLGSISTPHPYVMGALLLCGVLGGGLGIAIGLSRSVEGGLRKRGFTVLFGLIMWGSAGGFAYVVLANEDGDVEIVEQLPNVTRRFTKLRIVTFNVLHGFPDFEQQELRFRCSELEIQKIDADIIILQEAWSTTEHGSMAERLAKSLGMNHAYARANGSRNLIGFEEGAAILTRHPLIKAQRVVLQPHEPFWENRIALIAAIDLGGEIFTVAGVHLSTSIPDRQAKHLLEVLPTRDLLLVAGDFNAEPMSDAMTQVDRAGFLRLDPAEAKGYLTDKESLPLPKEQIDHIFLSPESKKTWFAEKSICVLTSRQWHCDLRQPISDHNAIVVDLRRR